MTFAVDFDGVIHRYSRGWGDGSIYDGVMDDAFFGLWNLMQKDTVFIFTSRKPKQVAKWIEEKADGNYNLRCTTRRPRTWWGKPKEFWSKPRVLLVTNHKYPARAYIDDRAYVFKDWLQTLEYFGIQSKRNS
jgi:hypothetical protein